MTIEIADLGSWGAVTLAAEYDAERDAIRIDARAVERVRRALGDAAARAFVAHAIEHERYHRAHPHATEAETKRHAALACGSDSARFEAALARR